VGRIVSQQLIRVLGRLQDALAVDDEQKAYLADPQFDIDSKVFLCICIDLQIDSAPFTGLRLRKEEWLNSPNEELFNETQQLFDQVFDKWESQSEFEIPEELNKALIGDKPTQSEITRRLKIQKQFARIKKEGVITIPLQEQKLRERIPDITQSEIRGLLFQDKMLNSSGMYTVETANEIMTLLFQRSESKKGDEGREAMLGWSAEKWSEATGFNRSTIQRTAIWDYLMQIREGGKEVTVKKSLSMDEHLENIRSDDSS